jgi:hypothetical protein
MTIHSVHHPRINLTIPGIDGSGAGHWQTWWEETRGDCRRVDLGDWDRPDPARWMARLDAAIRRQAKARPTLVAHSLGCILVTWWAHHHRDAARHVAGALLVAPCNPEGPRDDRLRPFAPPPRNPLPFPATLVASRDDPYASFDWSARFARSLGAKLIDAGPIGHINAEAGMGAWPEGQKLLEDLAMRRVTEREPV